MAVKKKQIKRKKPVRNYLICEKCEQKSQVGELKCSYCGSKSFLPDFVHKRRKVRGNFSINVVSSFSNPKEKVLNFYKWFPGRRWSINIAKLDDWEKIKNIIDYELGPHIGWKTKSELDKIISGEIKRAKDLPSIDVQSADRIPKFLLQVAKKINFEEVNKENQQYIVDGLKTITEVAGKYNKGFQAVFNGVIQKLPKEGTVALAQLEELLGVWSLKQIIEVASIVKDRLDEIKRFKDAIKKDSTFEIKGDNSIHRILEGAMWIVDERYWLMHSNETLRKFIGDGMAKKDKKKYGKKRPDFVCGSVDGKLIIMELKKPSHKLVTADLEQLETYLMIADEYTTKFQSFEAYLVGRRIDGELKKRLRYRKSMFKIRTFSDLVDTSEKRYKEYLKIVGTQKK